MTACIFMVAWLRSLFFNDEATFTVNDRIHMVWSLQGGFIWLSYDARGDMALRWGWHLARPDSYGGITRTEFAKDWRGHFERLDRPPRVWPAHYSTLVIPLTMISAWLLIRKPKAGKEPVSPPTI
jgi:hypothetical protein